MIATSNYFFVLIVLFIVVVLPFLLGQISGWTKLAQLYPYQNEPIAAKRSFQWMNINGISYKGCVTVGGSSQGLYLALMFFFNIGAPDLFIPWQHIRIIEKKYWWFTTLEMTFAQEPSVKIRIFQTLENFLQEIAGHPLAVERN